MSSVYRYALAWTSHRCEETALSSDLIVAENLAQAIRQVAGHARPEEDVRVGVEHALGAMLQALGLTAVPEYEKTTLSGSADAVYGHAVIEYKRPGRLAEKGFPAKLAAQVARYLADQASRAGGQARQVEALEKMIGIGRRARLPKSPASWPQSRRRWTRRWRNCGASRTGSCRRSGDRWRSWGERLADRRLAP